jgi:vacuolar-type H+-ATPase subunit I/STV1
MGVIMELSIVIGFASLFFSFMGFLFYILKMKIQPLEALVKQHKEDNEKDLDKLEQRWNDNFSKFNKKLDLLIEDDRDYRDTVIQSLHDLKLQKAEQHSENLEKYVSKEAFLLAFESTKHDSCKEIERLEKEIETLRA